MLVIFDDHRDGDGNGAGSIHGSGHEDDNGCLGSEVPRLL